ncbi:hypothetical protein [Pseudomonas sp. FP1740]|uniref:hypothetical protein n=1 Tax=Pseudomonas sp. FP1740 TaxID=2954078 RepID=UPI0027333225|nr:hypothetical protein [Pseudomonas sp. FP1740]WLG46922.1 hypothetical protein PSH69_10055 [Pseudomonas sp. FP1740]
MANISEALVGSQNALAFLEMLAWSELNADVAPVMIAKSIDMAQQLQERQCPSVFIQLVLKQLR